MFANLDWYSRRVLPLHGRADRDVHAAVRDLAHHAAGPRTSSSSASTARSSARRANYTGPENLPVRAARRSEPEQSEPKHVDSHIVRTLSSPTCRANALTGSHVRPHIQRPPRPDGPGRHRRLRPRVRDQQPEAYDTARLVPDRHAGLRPRGARLPGLHQAARARSCPGTIVPQRRARARHAVSSSTRSRPRSTSAR